LLVLPENGMDAVEELFRAKLITFLSKQGFLPPERARMLKEWKHSGFNVHRSRRIHPDECDVIEKILRCLRLWQQGVRVDPQRQSGTDPPNGEWVYEPID
ncbi:MAG: hypothetical protein P5672_26410, partial [Limnospira sp. PMC 1234.20]